VGRDPCGHDQGIALRVGERSMKPEVLQQLPEQRRIGLCGGEFAVVGERERVVVVLVGRIQELAGRVDADHLEHAPHHGVVEGGRELDVRPAMRCDGELALERRAQRRVIARADPFAERRDGLVHDVLVEEQPFRRVPLRSLPVATLEACACPARDRAETFAVPEVRRLHRTSQLPGVGSGHGA
jgi:hypothetical protein